MGWVRRLRSTILGSKVRAEFEEEAQFHLEQRAHEYVEVGMRPEEARREAKRRLGNLTLASEQARDVDTLRWLTDLGQDVRYAVRMLRKNPGFTVVTILTLAVGIGATTAMFSLLNAVLIRSLPYGDADRLAYITAETPFFASVQSRIAASGTGIGGLPPTNADFLDLQRDTQTFSSMALFGQTAGNLATADTPVRVVATRVTGDFFKTLQREPLLGRAIEERDQRASEGHVTVISHAFWQTRFGGDRAILQQTLTFDRQTYQIVGVMPPGFSYPGTSELGPFMGMGITELWIPMRVAAGQQADRDFPDGDGVVGRLRPGVTLSEAQAEMAALMESLDRFHSQWSKGWHPVVKSFSDAAIGKSRQLMWLLFGSVSLVLLIACSNAAHLLLARAASRSHELGVRAALGASRGRLLRQMLTEALLLAGGGGALGITLAYAAVHAIVLIDPGDISRLGEASIDGRVLLFSAGASLLTGLVFGLAPALAIVSGGVFDLLKRGSHGASRASTQLRQLLIVAEVGMAVVLLSGATLLVRSYLNVLNADRGFSSTTLTMRLSLDGRYARPDDRRAFFQRVLSEMRGLPGVDMAGGVTALPLSGSEGISTVDLKGFPTGVPTPSGRWVDSRWATGQYFEVMGTRLVDGRFLTDEDIQGRESVTVVNETFARTYSPGERPIGKQLSFDPSKGWSTIVGIVADTRHSNLEDAPPPLVYSSLWQSLDGSTSLYFAFRTRLPSGAVVSEIRRMVQMLDAGLAVADVQTMDERVVEAGAHRRFQTVLLVAFTALAVGLAGVGLYGLMAYVVRQRTAEIGIRIALGASRGDVVKLVLGPGMKLTAIGAAVGVVGSFMLTQSLAALLYGVTRTDPFAYCGVLVVLASVALAACYIPARRATQVDPIVALRSE